MTIRQRLEEAIRSFHLDALSCADALNVDLDTTLTVWAGAAYEALRRRLPGYHTATPHTIWRRFVSTAATSPSAPPRSWPASNPRTYSPVLRTADLPTIDACWWNGRSLRYRLT